MDSVTVYFDGGSGPKGASCAAVVLSAGELLIERSLVLETGVTSNVAEYNGLLLGVFSSFSYAPSHLEIVGDSKLLIEQLNGRWEVRAQHLKYLHRSVLVALAQMKCSWSARWVSREENKRADSLCRKALSDLLEVGSTE